MHAWLDPCLEPSRWGGRGKTQPSEQRALVPPDLILIASHLDSPGWGQPGEPVHGDPQQPSSRKDKCARQWKMKAKSARQ